MNFTKRSLLKLVFRQFVIPEFYQERPLLFIKLSFLYYGLFLIARCISVLKGLFSVRGSFFKKNLAEKKGKKQVIPEDSLNFTSHYVTDLSVSEADY